MKQPPTFVIQLIHMEGPLKGEIQEFKQSEISIGRSPACQVCFPKDLAIVSRVHARIVRDGNRFMLLDQSTNGTFLNGKLIKEAILKDGDVLLFAQGGPKVSFLTQTVERGMAAVESPAQPATFPAPSEPAPSLPPSPPPTPKPLPIPSSERLAVAPPPVPQPLAVPQPPAPKPAVPPVPMPPQNSGDIPVQQIKKPLVIQYGPTLQSYNSLPVTIGSGIQCDFKLNHPSVYERHAQIFYFQEQYWIKDLTGRNVIQINGRNIEGQGMLEADYHLSLGPQGPAFKFLGGGRLAEIETIATQETAMDTQEEMINGKAGNLQDKAVKQIGAMMKKILKR